AVLPPPPTLNLPVTLPSPSLSALPNAACTLQPAYKSNMFTPSSSSIAGETKQDDVNEQEARRRRERLTGGNRDKLTWLM
ncbi:hypothetical protein GBF38_008564, partial [Nibea albiflora]